MNLSPQHSLCAGNSATLITASSSTISWYTASNASSAIATGSAFVTPQLSAGTHSYFASSAACAHLPRTPFAVIVYAVPSLTISVPISTICAGESATLRATGAYSINWSNSATGGINVVNPQQHTTYTITGIEQSHGCSAQATVQVMVSQCLGIKDRHLPGLRVFPNPFSDRIVIETPVAGTATVFDMIGRVMVIQEIAPGSNTVFIRAAVSGKYVLRVVSEDSARNFTVIRQH